MKRYRVIAILGVLALVLTLAAPTPRAQDTGRAAKTYTAYNMWYEEPDTLFCINYKVGAIIPAGSEVKNARVTVGATRRTRGKPVITFTTVASNVTFTVSFTDKFHPGKTLEDYMKYMFTPKSFEEMTKGMSKAEIEAIRSGILVEGMSKNAVLMAYGYPPEHRTPTLNQNVWTYWTNRFRSKAVNFDASGRTTLPPAGPGYTGEI